MPIYLILCSAKEVYLVGESQSNSRDVSTVYSQLNLSMVGVKWDFMAVQQHHENACGFPLDKIFV